LCFSAIRATFIGMPAATFAVNGVVPPADLVLFAAGAQWRWRNGWSFLVKFNGEFAASTPISVPDAFAILGSLQASRSER
jgi:hypothetical protein